MGMLIIEHVNYLFVFVFLFLSISTFCFVWLWFFVCVWSVGRSSK